jgi:hypothetical protein
VNFHPLSWADYSPGEKGGSSQMDRSEFMVIRKFYAFVNKKMVNQERLEL